eukprot:m.12943 g.12943  ORF g.12943 m.12943 type:complete len:50 (-) comp4757_c0_seq1:143-292(-)
MHKIQSQQQDNIEQESTKDTRYNISIMSVIIQQQTSSFITYFNNVNTNT